MKSAYYEKLLGAISRMLAATTDEERERIIAENPILRSPKAIELIDDVIKDFSENVTIIDDFPLEWKKMRKFLGEKSSK
jgi:hypothetical protein